jgi:hypothetical protein
MREQHPALSSSPFEHGRIVGSSEARILDPHNIEIGHPTREAAYDVVVEILVGGELEH